MSEQIKEEIFGILCCLDFLRIRINSQSAKSVDEVAETSIF